MSHFGWPINLSLDAPEGIANAISETGTGDSCWLEESMKLGQFKGFVRFAAKSIHDNVEEPIPRSNECFNAINTFLSSCYFLIRAYSFTTRKSELDR